LEQIDSLCERLNCEPLNLINKPNEDGRRERKFRITQVEFDTDGDKALAKRLTKKYVGKCFLAESQKDADERAADIVSDASNWCVFSIDFVPCKKGD
jgi:hypothetical protein